MRLRLWPSLRQWPWLAAAYRWVQGPWDRYARGTAVGWVRFGSLRRLQPIGEVFGVKRGNAVDRCIDRYYIQAFLARHGTDIHGRVLEIADNTYTRRFGGAKVLQSDVLHAAPGNPQATIVADLTQADHIPTHAFDCIIVTQTLQYIYDLRAAMRTLYRILKPGGVLLATCPGISQTSRYDADRWEDYWRFTTAAAQALRDDADVLVQGHGNVLVAVAFLHGLLIEELRPTELDHHDSDYELLITVRATKPKQV